MNDEEEYVLTMPKVRTSDSHYIAWDRENVINQILADTQLFEKFYEYPPATRELAGDVARAVEEAIEGLDLKYLKSSMVREFVCLEFLKRGMVEYHNACMRVGTSLHDAHAIDTGEGYGARDNANLQANPETSHKHKADKMSKEQYLYMMPPKVADAHLKSYIHIHDLEYFGTRSFCMDASTIVPVFNGKQIKTLTPAEMMLDPNAPVSVPKENICAFTPHGTRPITKITRRNIDNDTMYKIRATNGKSVKVTENHRIPVIRNDTYLVIPASEVREGDELMTVNLQMNDCVASINLIDALIETVPERMLKNICVRNAREIIDTIGLKYIDISRKVGFEKHMKGWYTKGSIPIREFKQICETFGITDYKTCEVWCTGSPHTFPAILPLTNYLFEIMGAFVADGNYNVDEVKGHYNLVITDEPYHLSRYTMMLNEMGMHVTQCAPDTVTTSMIGNIVVSGKRTPQIYFGSKILYLLFHYIWGIGWGAHEKRLPNIIYNVGSPLLNAFMRGLFTGDGTVNYNQRTSNCAIMYSTVSEKLNQEIMLLLQMNGIVAGVYEVANETGTTCYRVRISGRDNIERFTHICTFMDERQDIVQEFLRNVNGITRINRNKNIVGSVESVTPSDEWVYDIFLDGDGSDESHTFIAGDGFLIHNCMDSDLRYLYYYGFMPDGKGSSASVSAPAKNPEVAVLHAVKYLAASQTNFAGGQGYYNFLTFIAPYFEGLDYTQIKQYMQMMVYELTQMMIARGGQVIFSSLQLSPGVPTLWRDIPVVYKGRIWNGEHDVPKRTYGEFEREVRLAFKALMDVMIEGDYWGKPFNFPKPEISIEPDFVTTSDEITAWDAEHPDIPTYKDLYLMAFDLAAKFGTPYFDNQIPAYRGAGKGISCYQCIPGDELIWVRTDLGYELKPIEDVSANDIIRVRGKDSGMENMLVRDMDGYINAVTLSGGRTIRMTNDHEITIKKNVEDEWEKVSAEKLNVGMFVKCEHICDVDKKVVKTAMDIAGANGSLEDFCEFAGIYTAEGNILIRDSKTGGHRMQLSFSINEEPIVDRVCELIRNLFGLQPKTQIIRGNERRIVVYGKEFCENLLKCGLPAKTGMGGYVPPFMFMAPESLKMTFLKSYYIGDGCNTSMKQQTGSEVKIYPRIAFESASEKTARGVHMLFKSIGFNPIIYKKNTRNMWVIALHHRVDIDKFYSEDNVKACCGEDLKITKIEKEWYTGKVYDPINVDGHEFVTGSGIIVGNCCLTGDTEVIVKRNGTVHTMPIEDLMPDDLLFTPTGFQPFASLLIQTIDGDTYEEDLVEITTDMGKVIRCTEDHMIPVHREDSMELTFVRADAVGIGDALCINNTLYYTDALDNLEELCDDLGEELIAAIKSVPYTGKVYDPINVEGRTFWLRNGILSSNCAYNFSSNIDEDDEFFDKVYFRNGAHFSMGSLQVVTLNCPRAAYDAGNDVEKLIRNLKNYMNVARDVFVIKKRWIDEIIKCNKLPFVVQRPRDPVTGEPGTMAVDVNGLVCTIGVLGFNEMVQSITGYQLHESKEARKTALYVLAELNKHARTLSEEVGLKIVVARTPAETTCQRFAVSDLLNPEYTEKARAVVHGDIEAFDRMKKTTRDLPVYYTNGTHVAVDAPVSLPERMNIENPFFVLVQGGNIFHVWLGEAHPDPRGLYDFCMNIATRTQIGYFALTRDMTVPVNRYTWYTGA